MAENLGLRGNPAKEQCGFPSESIVTNGLLRLFA